RTNRTKAAALQTVSSSNAHIVRKDEEVCLRDVFDLPTQTTVGSQWYRGGQPTGLLMEWRFQSPKSFRAAGKEAVAEAQGLVRLVVDARTADEKRQVIKCLDQLSDALCRVMDVAELVRQVHPDSSWQAAADQVYTTMLDYMNGLNTHVGLYQKLVEVVDDPAIRRTLSAVELAVAESFRRDFERSGIHLATTTHKRFVDLSSSIHEQSRDFIRFQSQEAGEAPRNTVDVPLDALRTLPGPVMMHIMQTSRTRKRSDGTAVATIAPDGYAVHYILRDCEDAGTREAVYRMWQRGSSGAVNALEQLLEDRLALARTVGFESFAHMSLDDKMARSPEHVDEFLRGLAAQAQPQWNAVVASLERTQALDGSKGGSSGIDPWSRDYWVSRQQMDSGALPSLSTYFSLGRVVLGLSRVFQSLYGVGFRAATPQPGEIWHPDVRKLEVVDEQGQLQGIIYCDVFTRSSKAHVGAAHFTARCARRVDDDIAVTDVRQEEGGNQAVVERDGKRFQLPVVVLICDFPAPSEGSPPLLGWNNVETIFHEMGHAMHSMLGQNGFHNVAGTRCPVDFVELPSILMEHFARSPQVLSTFASHHETGAPLPLELVTKHAERRRRYAALDLHTQLFMSALDQRYHSAALDPKAAGTSAGYSLGWSTRSLASVHNDPMFASRSRIFDYVPATRWQSRFTHLVGYGASYYAYLFDRVLAGQIWDRVFQGDSPFAQTAGLVDHSHKGPLSREAGERFKNEVLRWGGGRDPWLCVAAALDNGKSSADEVDAVAQGSRSAMRTVGSWRLPEL
ncbi:Mitochondrial intermediate peptidase, partial [Coemansia sp. RSA 1933]